MMSEGLAMSRPRMSTGHIVDRYDEFTHDQSVSKANELPVTFEFTIYYEPRYRTF
jgi:hypothetical protein